jgi:hypothetical protein
MMYVLGYMRKMRAVMAVALAGLWMAVGSHCLLEHVLGFDFLRCEAPGSVDAPPWSHCEDEVCQALESGQYLSAGQIKAPVVALGVLVLQPSLAQGSPPSDLTSGVLAVAPPVLSRIWQFSLRTALLPRAPSSVA